MTVTAGWKEEMASGLKAIAIVMNGAIQVSILQQAI